MTPNEKKLLAKFKVVDKASVVKISSETGYSIDYTDSLCQSLVAQGFLEVAIPGRWPAYKVREQFREQPSYQEKRREWGGRLKNLLETEQEKEKIEVLRPIAEVKCAYCKGTGKDPWGITSVLTNCQVCKGKGRVKIEKPFQKCPVCQGTGVQYKRGPSCLACGGKGVLTVPEGRQVCPECAGTGKGAFGLCCLKCKGTGKIRKIKI